MHDAVCKHTLLSPEAPCARLSQAAPQPSPPTSDPDPAAPALSLVNISGHSSAAGRNGNMPFGAPSSHKFVCSFLSTLQPSFAMSHRRLSSPWPGPGRAAAWWHTPPRPDARCARRACTYSRLGRSVAIVVEMVACCAVLCPARGDREQCYAFGISGSASKATTSGFTDGGRRRGG